jgi:hypothetical protein
MMLWLNKVGNPRNIKENKENGRGGSELRLEEEMNYNISLLIFAHLHTNLRQKLRNFHTSE